ncbi:MAG: hypothetical protein J0I06_10180, partial [Planctomycetes bacterium]|nr:hypothetical protein [Planctomycetota bacterium]
SLARIERQIARVNEGMGNPEGARRAFERAKTHLEYLLEHNSPRSTLRADLAGVCHQLGVALARLQKHQEAAAAAAEAVKHYRVLLDRSPADAGARKNLSSVLGNLAFSRRALRQLPEALRATEDRVLLWPDNPNELYDAATDFASTFELASQGGQPAAPARDRALGAAVGALRRAVRAGFADRQKIRTDPRFSALRETAEFRALLRELPEPPP